MWTKVILAAAAVIPTVLASGVGYDGHSSIAKRSYLPHYPVCLLDFEPFEYVGCYNDQSPNALRFNPGVNGIIDGIGMTIERCQAACKNNGFRYAGLYYYGRCACGSYIASTPWVDTGVAGQGCTFACSGNRNQICGGNKLVSIYADPTYNLYPHEEDLSTQATEYQAVGCFQEITGRFLTDDQPDINGDSMTVELCLARCGSQGYAYAGLEYGRECYCAGKLPLVKVTLPDSSCNSPCKGDLSQTCGGSKTIYVYYNENLDTSEPCNDLTPNPGTTTTTTVSTTTTTPPYEEPEPTTTTTPPYEEPEPTTTTTPPYEEPEPTTTTTPPYEEPEPTTTTTPPYEEPEPTTTSTATTTTTTTPRTTPPTTTSRTTTTRSTTTRRTTTASCRTRCGGYCAPPLPTYTHPASCKEMVKKCWGQVEDCVRDAGYDAEERCKDLAKDCAKKAKYCDYKCSGWKCNPRDCDDWDGHYQPPKPTYTKPKPRPTYTPKPKPTPTKNLCATPTAYKDPVGGVKAPVVSCNEVKKDYDGGKCWKVFSSYKTSECASFKRNDLSDACIEACNIQYENCRVQYAGSCGKPKRGRKRDVAANLAKRTWGSSKWIFTWARGGSYDSYNSALDKCKKQRDACVRANSNLSHGNRYCKKYGYFD